MTNDINKLIEDNMNIAYKLTWQYYKKFGRKIEFEELQSVSFLGLTKAANTFDKNKGSAFSTYAYKCISNELLYFYKSNKKYINTPVISLSAKVIDDKVVEDILPDNYNIEDDIISKLDIELLYKYIDNLPSIDKTIILYRLEGKRMEDIGDIIGYSQSQISRLYARALNRLRDRFKD